MEQRRRVAQLHGTVRAGLSDKVTFEQKPQEGGKVSHVALERISPQWEINIFCLLTSKVCMFYPMAGSLEGQRMCHLYICAKSQSSLLSVMYRLRTQ